VANTKSAEKRWRQSLKRRMRNRFVRTTTRTYIKSVNRSIGAGEPDGDELKLAIRALDKAAEKGIIHPNNAARRKSRLMHRFAVAVANPVEAAPVKPARGARAASTRTATRKPAAPRVRKAAAS